LSLYKWLGQEAGIKKSHVRPDTNNKHVTSRETRTDKTPGL